MKNLTFFVQTAVIALIIGSFSTAFASDLQVLQEKSFPTQAGKKFTLNSCGGNVAITTWDKPEVYVKILGNKKAEEKVSITMETNDEGVKILAKKERSIFHWFSFGSGIEMRYEVTLPKEYSAQIATSGGDIEIYSLKGAIYCSTSGGDVNIDKAEGNLNVSTSGGEITANNHIGWMDLSTSGGDIKCENFNGSMKIATSGGDIVLNGTNGKIQASTSGGDIRLTYWGNNNGIELATSGGDIEAKLPDNFAADVILKTSGGEITCGLPLTSSQKKTESTIIGQISGGGNKVECRTSGGDIVLMK